MRVSPPYDVDRVAAWNSARRAGYRDETPSTRSWSRTDVAVAPAPGRCPGCARAWVGGIPFSSPGRHVCPESPGLEALGLHSSLGGGDLGPYQDSSCRPSTPTRVARLIGRCCYSCFTRASCRM